MSRKSSIEYEPLASHDSNLHTFRTSEHYSANATCRRRYSVAMICFFVQIVNLILFLGGHALMSFAHSESSMAGLNNYFELAKYNTTKYFLGNVSLVLPSLMADEFWDRIQRTDGIVTVPTEWAVQHFIASAPSPDNPDHSIYQVDVFHSIHCLYRIRNRLVSNSPYTDPLSDTHTLHCIDYLREQLMCHGDMTLQATKDYFKFDKNYGHRCRDHNALKDWVVEHSWEGHKKYLETELGVKFKDEFVAVK